MAILINAKPYRGRFHEEAKKLVLAGTRVGFMWCSGEKEVHCHMCGKDFVRPQLDPINKDAMGECTHCKGKFIFADATLGVK